MSEKPSRRVAVVLERTPVASPWTTHQWQAASAMPDVGGEPRVLLERDGLLQKVFPGFTVTLHADEAEGYYLNMSSGEPCVFVSIRTDEEGEDPYPFQVTAPTTRPRAGWMAASAWTPPPSISSSPRGSGSGSRPTTGRNRRSASGPSPSRAEGRLRERG